MKVIKDRQEIAQAINFGRFPVIKIECKRSKRDSAIIDGGAVRVHSHSKVSNKDIVEWSTVKIFQHEYYGDGHAHVNIGSHCIGLTASFTGHDLDEMATYANAPLIKNGDEVVFVLLSEDKRKCAVVSAKVIQTTSFCITNAKLEDGASEAIAKIAFDIAK